uniref:ORF2 protein n=1 Tax=Carrot ophiovirus 1 TaxID=2976692 RepID=A0A977QZJ3_9VIRU|nr:ORF2 protein [Carrot ophiovirus 1]
MGTSDSRKERENEKQKNIVLELQKPRIHLFLNYHVKSLHLQEEKVNLRNKAKVDDFLSYETSYKEVTRFLFGSWLMFHEEFEAPFNPKGIIIINTSQPLVDVADHHGTEIILSNDIESAIDSFYIHVYKEDLIIYTSSGDLLKITDDIKLPKYFAKLDTNQLHLKKRIEKKFVEISKTSTSI